EKGKSLSWGKMGVVTGSRVLMEMGEKMAEKDNVDIWWARNTHPSSLSMKALYSSHIACFQLRSHRAWKRDLGMWEEVVTWKFYLGLAFTILTLERVTIGCCEVDGGGGGGGKVFGGSVVFSGDGVGNGVGGVVCGVACGVVCGGVC
nr:hypothetical protein [Tanacetum cinerariifolium]